MEGRVLTCVYCGHEYPQNTPAWGNQVLTDHIKICPKHPMRQAEATIDKMKCLLREVMAWHSDKDSRDYNDCDQTKCLWCEQAQELIDSK